jgi:hypothetical protein
MDGLELISKDILFVIIFLIPGYIGFETTLYFFTILFPAFKYRYGNNIGPMTIIVISILWSSFTFWILFNILNFNQMIESLDISKMFVMILTSIGIAEIISIGDWLLLIISLLMNTAIGFFLNYKPINKNFEYWSKKRFWAIWKESENSLPFLDKMYLEIIEAIKNKNKVKIHLKNKDEIEGIIQIYKTYGQRYIEISEFIVKDDKKMIMIRLKDIDYVEIYEN